MTEPVDRMPSVEEAVLPEEFLPGVDRLRERFRLLREGNEAAYLATSEEKFITRVEEDPDGIADQRTYLMSQIQHSHIRARVLMGDRISNLPPLVELNRQDLINLLKSTGEAIYTSFGNRSNLGKIFTVPYAGDVTGLMLLTDIAIHEADHLGLNEGTLGHFGISRPPAVTIPLGR
jgi:hypothetical protein